MPTRFDIRIAGVDVLCRIGTLSINETTNGRNRLSCEILSLDATYRPNVGDEIIVEDNGTRVFGGNIATPSEHVIDDQLAIEEFATTIEAADFNAIADRITVIDGGFPPGFTVKQAATSLVGYLAPYGVTLDPAQVNGPVLPLMVYDIKRVSAWFNEISIITGFVWEIDYNKVLRFIEPGTVAAAFNIADDDGHTVGDIVVEPSDVDYANRVIVLAGEGQREVTEALTFNGTDDFIDLTYNLVGHRGYLTVNGDNENLGGSPAMWVFDSIVPNRIRREAGAPSAGTGEIIYTAQFPYIAQADDVGEQSGPRGVVDTVIRKVDVFDATLAEALADGYLARLVAEPIRIRYSSFTAGLHPGRTQTIASSVRDISVTALITDVRARDINGETMRYDVTAVEGDVYPGSWRDESTGGGGSSVGAGGTITVISSGGVGGSGTVGSLAQWTTPTTLGVATFANNGVLYGNGTGAVQVTGAGGTNTVLTANGGAPSFSATPTVTSIFTTGNSGIGTSSPGTVNGIDLSSQRVLHVLGSGIARLSITGTIAALDLVDSDASANQKWLNIVCSGGTFSIRSLDDAAGVIHTPISFGMASGGNLTLAPAGDIVLNPTGNDILPSTNYDLNLGSLSLKYLTLHAAELWVETLVAQNTLATIGGRILVGPTTTLTADLASGATTITVKHNQMANGDRVYLEADGKVEFMAITSGAGGSAGAYTYSVTRNLDGSGANDWFAGDAVFNTGTTGDGFIDIYSFSGGMLSGTTGPTIVGNVRTGTTYNNLAARWAIGNLDGLYGYGADTYGAAFGDPSATNITIDATNGIRIRHSTTNKLHADTSGNLSLTGDLVMSTSGVFRAGATAFGTTTGWWMDYNGGTPRFRIGNPAGNRLSWDGTDLTLVSASVNIDSSGISLGVPTSSLSALYGYNIASSYSGTNFQGVYAFEGSSTDRTVDLLNSTTASGKTIRTFVLAQNDSFLASLQVFVDGTNAFIEVNRLRPSANNAVTCGDSTKRWSEVFAVNGVINTSDATLKSELRDSDLGTAFLLALAPKSWTWTDGPDLRRHYGFTAQDVAAVVGAHDFGGLARDPDGRPTGLNYSAFIAPLVSGFQDHEARLRALEERRHG